MEQDRVFAAAAKKARVKLAELRLAREQLDKQIAKWEGTLGMFEEMTGLAPQMTLPEPHVVTVTTEKSAERGALRTLRSAIYRDISIALGKLGPTGLRKLASHLDRDPGTVHSALRRGRKHDMYEQDDNARWGLTKKGQALTDPTFQDLALLDGPEGDDVAA